MGKKVDQGELCRRASRSCLSIILHCGQEGQASRGCLPYLPCRATAAAMAAVFDMRGASGVPAQWEDQVACAGSTRVNDAL